MLYRLRSGAAAAIVSTLAAAGPTAFVAAPIFLAACATTTPAQATTDVQAIAQGLSGIVGALQALPNNPVPAAVIAQIQAEIAVINTNASSIGNALVPSASVATAISNAVNAIVPLVTPFFPAAPAVAAVVQAAVSLVTIVLASAGVTGAASSAPSAIELSKDRAILRDAAAHGIH